jgi:hypothetical protein
MALLTRFRSWVVVTVVAIWAAVPALAQPANGAEANLKAVFLFNFSKYVSWPGRSAGERGPSEIRICVPAEDEFFARLRAVVQGEAIDGKPLHPIALTGLDDAKECEILFVGDANSLDGKAWLSAVRGRQVLTVGDGPLNDDTVIAFIRDQNRIRFDINRAAAARRGLNVSAKLLRLARRVKDR